MVEQFYIDVTQSKQLLEITANNRVLGTQYNHLAQQLNFVRPAEYAAADLCLLFCDGFKDFEPVNIGQENSFVIPNSLTQTTRLTLQILYLVDGEEKIRSNKLTFTLRPSINSGNIPVEPWPDPLLQLTNKAFTGVTIESDIISFENLSGEIVGQVQVPGGSGGEYPPAGGIPLSDLSEPLQEAVGKANNSVQYTNEQNIVLQNDHKLLGTDTHGTQFNLIEFSPWDVVDIGSTHVHANINSSVRPTVQLEGMSGEDAEEIAYLSDIEHTATDLREEAADIIGRQKDSVLGAVTITSLNSDIDKALGINGNFYIQNENIAGLPVREKGGMYVLSDTDRTNTLHHFLSESKNNYYRNSTSVLDIATGTQGFTITATSGSEVASETLIFNSTATERRLLGQLGIGGQFTIDLSTSTGVVLAGAVDFYSNSTAFRENGFTLTIKVENEVATDQIEVNFPPYGGGDPVVVSDVTTGSKSYIRYQSGEQLNAGGSEASIYITATWTDYTGTPAWSEWTGGSGAINTGNVLFSETVSDSNTSLSTTAKEDCYLQATIENNIPATDGISNTVEVKVDGVTLDRSQNSSTDEAFTSQITTSLVKVKKGSECVIDADSAGTSTKTITLYGLK